MIKILFPYKTLSKFPDEKGYGLPVKAYEICDRPDVCNSCTLQKDLKKECRSLVNLRLSSLSPSFQPDLFGGAI